MYGHHTAGIKNFDSLKTWANWAGVLGLVSSHAPVPGARPLEFVVECEGRPRGPIR